MLLIVAHHYVVNSGLTSPGGPIATNPLSAHSLFLLLYGAWGKTGVNCFVLITGYFMCNKSISLKKFLKLLCVIMFYQIGLFTIFCVTGYAEFSVVELLKAIIPVRNLEDNFETAYIVFFLFIPFLNIIIHAMTEKQHVRLLALTGFAYIVLGTLPGFSVWMNYASWFIVLYFISSYIRLYPKKIFDNTKFWGIATIVCVILSSLSVVALTWLDAKLNMEELISYFFVTDCNTLLAVLTALSAFMFFKNINVPQNTFINAVASTTFGVLLIHANSDTMRQWLWQDTLHDVKNYFSTSGYIHAILSVLGVFIVCSCIDYLRIRFIEKPFFHALDKRIPRIVSWYKRIENGFFEKCHIQ